MVGLVCQEPCSCPISGFGTVQRFNSAQLEEVGEPLEEWISGGKASWDWSPLDLCTAAADCPMRPRRHEDHRQSRPLTSTLLLPDGRFFSISDSGSHLVGTSQTLPAHSHIARQPYTGCHLMRPSWSMIDKGPISPTSSQYGEKGPRENGKREQ
jgi:hypothetical protein